MSNQIKEPLYSERYKWYVLFIITLVGTVNFFDRQLVVILAEPIRAELDLSDKQLGLMTGLAFALFYCLVGIPVARLADISNRRNIIAASLTVWSFMTAVTGYVQGFTQMLLARIGVGVGESGSSPSSQAMISDYFPPEKRATAFAIWATSIYLGLFLGFALGGYFAETLGWRQAFKLVGLPGIFLAIVVLLTVKEPPKGYSDNAPIEEGNRDIKTDLKILFSRKTFLYICLASGLHSFVGYSFANWIPSFFIRVHEMTIAQVGFWLAISIGIGGGIGAFSGGFLADKLAKKDRRWYVWIAIWAIILTIPFSYYTLLTDNKMGAIMCYFIPNVLFSLNMGATLTVIHGVVEIKMRALSSAIYYFVINLVGLGLGPLVVGAMSDYLMPTYGNESLRYALLMVSIIYLICIYFYYKAGKTLIAEMEK